MYTVLIALFVFVAILMTITILMQSAKGGGLAASFGGMGAGGGVFGPRGAANFLQKATTILAITYGLLCLIIGFIGRPGGEAGSVIQRELQRDQQMEAPLPVAPFSGEGVEEMPGQTPPPAESEEQPPAEGQN